MSWTDRKSTRLNSSHLGISYAVFCLKKKKPHHNHESPASTPAPHPPPTQHPHALPVPGCLSQPRSKAPRWRGNANTEDYFFFNLEAPRGIPLFPKKSLFPF